jgi:aspartate carbamoyltransferase catalytic subunit
MTRVQQERFTDPMEYERVKDVYTLNASMLGNVRDNMKILHPLPRVTEIEQDVDETKYAYYFKQAENGLYVRMAIISYLLGYRPLK